MFCLNIHQYFRHYTIANSYVLNGCFMILCSPQTSNESHWDLKSQTRPKWAALLNVSENNKSHKFWIWGLEEIRSSFKNPRHLGVETTLVCWPWIATMLSLNPDLSWRKTFCLFCIQNKLWMTKQTLHSIMSFFVNNSSSLLQHVLLQTECHKICVLWTRFIMRDNTLSLWLGSTELIDLDFMQKCKDKCVSSLLGVWLVLE